MKRESRFDPGAVSDAGACGLMQIMPETAHGIGSAKPVNGECPDRLFDPATNMELGQKYVRVLAGTPMIGNNLLLLLASYNGGPANVAHWLESHDRKDPLLFLESMPVRETRDYVQNVLMHYWTYRVRLAEPENSVAQLARGEWPRYALNDGSGLRQAKASAVEELASASK
jgi:soluble lytic murein transglycosylase